MSIRSILIDFVNGIFNHSHAIAALIRALLTDSIVAHIAYIIDIDNQQDSINEAKRHKKNLNKGRGSQLDEVKEKNQRELNKSN